MAFRYTLGIKARGRGYREARITAANDTAMRRATNALLEFGTEVTVIKKTRIKSKK